MSSIPRTTGRVNEAPLDVTSTLTGRVVRVIRSRACGFIRCPDGPDVFFHATDLHDMMFDELEERLPVRFQLVADTVSGPRAVRVQIDRQVAAPGRISPRSGAPRPSKRPGSNIERPRG